MGKYVFIEDLTVRGDHEAHSIMEFDNILRSQGKRLLIKSFRIFNTNMLEFNYVEIADCYGMYEIKH